MTNLEGRACIVDASYSDNFLFWKSCHTRGFPTTHRNNPGSESGIGAIISPDHTQDVHSSQKSTLKQLLKMCCIFDVCFDPIIFLSSISALSSTALSALVFALQYS